MNAPADPAGDGPAGLPPAPIVVLYGRPGCHLCDQALDVIERLRARVAFVFVQVDIESDRLLFTRYLERIPVITVDGREAFELFVQEHELESALTGT